MAFREDFIAELRSISEVQTNIGERTFPLVDRGHELPSIVYNMRGETRDSFTEGSFGLRETFVQIDIYHNSYGDLNTIRDAILMHFNGFIGYLNSSADDGGTFVSSTSIINTRELVDQQDDTVYRAIIEINLLSH